MSLLARSRTRKEVCDHDIRRTPHRGLFRNHCGCRLSVFLTATASAEDPIGSTTLSAVASASSDLPSMSDVTTNVGNSVSTAGANDSSVSATQGNTPSVEATDTNTEPTPTLAPAGASMGDTSQSLVESDRQRGWTTADSPPPLSRSRRRHIRLRLLPRQYRKPRKL